MVYSKGHGDGIYDESSNSIRYAIEISDGITAKKISIVEFKPAYQEVMPLLEKLRELTSPVPSPSAMTDQLSSPQWPQFGYDPESTGRSPNRGPAIARAQWAFKEPNAIRCRMQIYATPAVLDDSGNLYFGLSNGYFVSLTPQKTERWRYALADRYDRKQCDSDRAKEPGGFYDHNIRYSPIIDNTGTVYFGTSGALNAKKFIALDKDTGKEKWNIDLNGSLNGHPKLGHNGKIYFTTESRVYSVDSNRHVKSVQLANHRGISPAVTRDSVYVCARKSLVAFNLDLTKKWEYRDRFITKLAWCAPAVNPEAGLIHFVANGPRPMERTSRREHRLYAVNTDGTLAWTADTYWVEASPAIGYDGTIYVGACDLSINTRSKKYMEKGNGLFMAYSPDGREKWRYYIPPVLGCKKGTDPDCPDTDHWKNARCSDSAPIVDPGGTIYFDSDAGLYIALNPDGSEKWLFDRKSAHFFFHELDGGGIISKDGTLYLSDAGGQGGGVYAVSEP
ncbi:PQQ-binding-like beta-propeller repeat protein [Acidobacteriota bacterium]